jgi:hypothetical protein
MPIYCQRNQLNWITELQENVQNNWQTQLVIIRNIFSIWDHPAGQGSWELKGAEDQVKSLPGRLRSDQRR